MSYLERNTVITISSTEDFSKSSVLSQFLNVIGNRATYSSVTVLPVHQNVKAAGLTVKTVEAKVMKDGKETKEMVEQKQTVYSVEIKTVKSGVWTPALVVSDLKANGLIKNDRDYSVIIKTEV